MASLYSAHLSPMAAFSSVYAGSRSKRGTEGRLRDDLTAVDEVVAAALAALDESGRLRAAGSICMIAGGLGGARRGEAEGRLGGEDYAFMKPGWGGKGTKSRVVGLMR